LFTFSGSPRFSCGVDKGIYQEAGLSVPLVNCSIVKGVLRAKSRAQKPQSKRTSALAKLLVAIAISSLLLLSCRATDFELPDRWSTYHNPRYDFEFPYPSNWIPAPMPDNLDGRAFRDPQNPTAEIRGWATNRLSGILNGIEEDGTSALPHDFFPGTADGQPPQNFTTEQGVTGKLQVNIDRQTSAMTLTLTQGLVRYSWQGECQSEQFAQYYRFFNYIARQYRIPLSAADDDF
jgi:hypothetical protein